ncbi:MAG: DUF1761 domain-containing protein [Bacteroidia bacterium]|nr:DUF1761 domain-containing protein [Bacteroidia bacterium]
MNIAVIFIAALIPLIVGFIWYHPKVFGTTWMKAAGLSEEDGKNANMALIFGLTYVFSVMLAVIFQTLVIHQSHIQSLFFLQPIHDPASEAGALYKNIMDQYGNSYRTLKHGAFHGTIAGVFIALPLVAINALFERKGFKYIAVNSGYWILSFALMGAAVCAFL